MEFVKETNRYKCRCEKCGSMMEYKYQDPNIENVGNSIERGYRICPVCGHMIHELLGKGELQK